MKNLQKLFSMAMLVCMAVALFSCSKDEEELGVEAGIVGKWEISSIEELVNGQSPDKFVEQMAQQLGISVEEFEDKYGDFNEYEDEVEGTIEYKDDKTFCEHIEDDEKAKGTWSAGENRTLKMKYAGETTYEVTYDVKSLKSNNASLSISFTDTEEIGDEEMEIDFEVIIHLKR